MTMVHHRGKRVTVQIDNATFNSIKEAAAFLEMHVLTLGKILNNNDEHIIKGFKVKRLSKFSSHAHGYVYCKRTGKLYESAAKLSKALCVDSVVVNQALKAGSYVDDFNNRWIRINKEEATDIIKNQEINKNIPQPKIDINTPALIKATDTVTSTKQSTLVSQCNEIENNVQDLLSTLIHTGKYVEAHKALDALANFKDIFNKVE